MIDINNMSSSEYFSKIGKELSFLTGIDSTIAEMGKSLGVIISESTKLNASFLQNRQRIQEMQYAIADAIPGVQRLGGEISDVTDTISKIALASRRNVIANTESVEKLYASSKLLNQDVGSIVDGFADVGVTFNNIGKNLEESIEYVQSIGGNAADVMRDVLDSTGKLNRFNFANGVQGLTKMAAQASMLRFDMNQTFSLAEEALDPEKAVELSSAFQRLGVMSGTLSDPFQLMNQSINDPEGLQNSIVEMSKQFTYFDEKTKSFKINPQGMLTLRQIAKETGLGYEQLTKMGLAASELDSRLNKINPRITFQNEEDKQYLANIASMNEQGEYTVKIKDEKGNEDIKNLSDVTQEEMDKLIEEQKKPQQTLEDLQRHQLTAAQALAADVSAIKNKILGGLVTAPTLVNAAETVGETFKSVSGTASKTGTGVADVPTVRGYSEDFISSVTGLVKDLASGEKNIGDATKDFLKKGEELFGKLNFDANLGSEKYMKSLKEDLLKKGIDINPILEGIKDIDDKYFGANNKTSDGMKKSKEKSSTPTSESNIIYGEIGKRISETLSSNNEVFSESIKGSSDNMENYTKSFISLINQVKENQRNPEQINEWLSQNKDELEKYGNNFYGTLEKFSQTFQSKIKENDVSGVDALIGEFSGEVKTLGKGINDEMKKYKDEFDGIAKKVIRGEESNESLTKYIETNQQNFGKLGGDFSKKMNDYAKDVSDKVKKDEKTLADITKIQKEISEGKKTGKDLEDYFKKVPDSIERLGLTIEKGNVGTQKIKEEISDVKIGGKSSFIEGKTRSVEPIQAGQTQQGGQSLTQLIQHKVEFGKITVDVQLPNNFSQLTTEQQQRILDQVFNDNKFKELFNNVKELNGNQLKQANQ